LTGSRQVLPGTTYLVTRRCAQRQFLLRPSARTNDVVGYVLAVAAQRYHIQLHAVCALSNHLHIVLTDPEACLPAFSQYFDSLVARALNSALGRWESFWAPSSYSAVRLLSPEDVIDKAAYTLANPVAAGLVQRGPDWPGLWSTPERVGAKGVELVRPRDFFRSNGSMPAHATLEFVCPPGFDTAEEFAARLAAALSLREDAATATLKKRGRSCVGRAGVLAQGVTEVPATTADRRNMNPRVGCRDKWRRIEALGRLKSFLQEYRLAWTDFRRGLRDVLFPAGTYWMRLAYGVRCASPP
jgi:putative transposase